MNKVHLVKPVSFKGCFKPKDILVLTLQVVKSRVRTNELMTIR